LIHVSLVVVGSLIVRKSHVRNCVHVSCGACATATVPACLRGG
jgi:hypothetical protein